MSPWIARHLQDEPELLLVVNYMLCLAGCAFRIAHPAGHLRFSLLDAPVIEDFVRFASKVGHPCVGVRVSTSGYLDFSCSAAEEASLLDSYSKSLRIDLRKRDSRGAVKSPYSRLSVVPDAPRTLAALEAEVSPGSLLDSALRAVAARNPGLANARVTRYSYPIWPFATGFA